MGIFFQQVELVNRTADTIEIMFDGQRVHIKPNYTKAGERIPGVVNMVPKQVVSNALNQSVILGTEKAKDPSSFESKLGLVPKEGQRKLKPWNDCSFYNGKNRDGSVNTEISRVSQADLMDNLVLDPTAKLVVKGKLQRDEDYASPRQIFDVVPG